MCPFPAHHARRSELWSARWLWAAPAACALIPKSSPSEAHVLQLLRPRCLQAVLNCHLAAPRAARGLTLKDGLPVRVLSGPQHPFTLYHPRGPQCLQWPASTIARLLRSVPLVSQSLVPLCCAHLHSPFTNSNRHLPLTLPARSWGTEVTRAPRSGSCWLVGGSHAEGHEGSQPGRSDSATGPPSAERQDPCAEMVENTSEL